MKNIIRRVFISFACSAFAGLLCNLLIDVIVNGVSDMEGFISMSPEFLALFPTPAIAAYVNIILYGLIGAAFAGMTFIYDIDRIGFVIQSIIYFVGTSIILTIITFVIWQLWKYPPALISTILGFFLTYVIINIVVYNTTRKDISDVNRMLETIE